MSCYSKMNASVTAKVFRVKILLQCLQACSMADFLLYKNYVGGCPLSRDNVAMGNVQNHICITYQHISQTL
jgi:hypothetical protein